MVTVSVHCPRCHSDEIYRRPIPKRVMILISRKCIFR
ncbi:hypothetical protein CE195_02870 [Sodalis-like symbiont of Philaenus spumarius]|nr:hypothetical protein CE195_02870 [Sodalis-like symbiont of Philaenus spumarius]